MDNLFCAFDQRPSVPERAEDLTRSWQTPHRGIWRTGPPKRRSRRILQWLRDFLASSAIWIAIVGGPFVGLITFLEAYYLGGPVFFGPVLLLTWSVLIVSVVLVLERTGYARNFENRHVHLTKSLAGLGIAALSLGIVYFLITYGPRI
jgi:hypothetical protein